jgi:hypothetical protein
MGVESYLVLCVLTDECCHPDRFRVELLLIESLEIRRLDFPNRVLSNLLIVFLPNEKKLSDRYRCKTIRRECGRAKTRIAPGKPGTWMKSKRRRHDDIAVTIPQDPGKDHFCTPLRK